MTRISLRNTKNKRLMMGMNLGTCLELSLRLQK